MSLFVTSLNSGSNGNCYYVGSESEAILVDAGISCRETERRMLRLGLSMQNVKAVFISHEHSDHIRGLPVLAKKYKLPVYITGDTMREGRLTLAPDLVRSFCAEEKIQVGGFFIKPFRKFHDACDPHSFTIEHEDLRIGVFTDIGTPCEHLVHEFRQCHAAFLETNYDEAMLENGRYPYFLKKRIRGGNGHLSNAQALELFTTHRPAFMSHLFLSHLSQDNNCPTLVQQLFDQHANGTKIIVASRYAETPLFKISA